MCVGVSSLLSLTLVVRLGGSAFLLSHFMALSLGFLKQDLIKLPILALNS